ncbi:MAG: NAD(P)-dependent oxidoreductase [Clostridia bacterium]|jgi:nucleoside-diphosphate-sugar epimerase
MSEAYDIQFMQKHIKGFKNKHVLITGATGFFGSWMFNALYECDALLVRADHKDLNKYLQYTHFDYIFHFAPTPIEPVIECAKRSNAKILYASTGAVYGTLHEKATEDMLYNTRNDYAIEKARNEMVLKRSGLDYCIARLFAFCGTGMKNHFAITAFVDAVKNNRPLVVYSHSVRSYMYIADAIVWLCKLMQSENGIYNVGGNHEITIDKLAQRVSSYVIPRAEVLESDKAFYDPQPYYVPDCSKARDLELQYHFNLEYGIRQMLEYKTRCDECEFFGDIDRTHCIECEEK